MISTGSSPVSLPWLSRWICAGLLGAASLETARTAEFEHVEPLLQQHCVECHGATEPEGGLDLESIEGLRKGGQSGPAVVPGKSRESLLIQAIEGAWGKTGKNQFMPPGKREHLKPEQAAVIKAWIDAGAPAPKQPSTSRALDVPRIAPRVEPKRPVTSLAYDPKSRVLALARPGGIELLDIATRRIQKTFPLEKGSIHAIVFAPDGRSLFVAGGEPGIRGEWRQWSVVDGTVLRQGAGHRDAIDAVAVDATGRWLATGGYDYAVGLWDTTTGERVRTISASQGAITALAFRPNGPWLASASFDRTAKLFNVNTGERVETFGQALKELNAVIFTPDAQTLLTGGNDNRIRSYRVAAEPKEGANPLETTVVAHEGGILQLVVSRDGRHLATAGDDRAVKLFELPTLRQRVVLEPQPDWPTALAFIGDDTGLVVGRADGSTGFYQVGDGKPAALPKPILSQITPRGLQRGQATRLMLSGPNVENATAVLVYKGGLHAAMAPQRMDGALEITLEPGAAEPRGAWEIAVQSASGESGRMSVWVDDLPQMEASAGLLKNGASVWGSITNGTQVDRFQFQAGADSTWIFDVRSRELGFKANLQVALLDSEGRILASNEDFNGSEDPFLVHHFTSAGTFRLRLSEQALSSSPGEHQYRITAGTLPFITGVYPLAVPSNQRSMVQYIGVNLPEDGWLQVEAGAGNEVAMPERFRDVRTRRPVRLETMDLPVVWETEPNDIPEKAQPVALPVAIQGRFDALGGGGKDEDLFSVSMRKGERWVMEALAASRGSLADTFLEVLSASGQPVERLRLQAVRNSAVTFRNETSDDTGIRFENWEEMELNDFLYANGEVMKILRAPQGPDSDTLLYSANGKRRGYFDTTPMAHPVEQPVYVVEPIAVGQTPTPNGLPTFRLSYQNDDDAERRLGTDARLYFTAPADGTYLVRVRDARGFHGAAFVYQLRIRKQAPDFQITVSGANPTVARGSGQSFTLNLLRRDGFDGPVRVDINGLPPGWQATTPLLIEAGHEAAVGVLNAAADVPETPETVWDNVSLVATAEVEGRPVAMAVPGLGRPKLAGEAPKLTLRIEPPADGVAPEGGAQPEILLAPGTTVRARLVVVRNGFEGAVRFEAMNLPHGVIVDNLGLNGITLLAGENERELFLTCARWVSELDRYFHLEETAVGRQASKPVLLKVRRKPLQARAP